VIPTPALDRIAAQGLRYTNFHSTALCSPTRAAIITGRNHHSVKLRQAIRVTHSIIPIEKGTIGTILKAKGYATSWFGKNHNMPSYQSIRPGRSNNGRTEWASNISTGLSAAMPASGNTTAIYPFQDNPSWNLTTAMADEAIQYMKQLKEIAPEKPFFIYYVPGGTHAPHHPTPAWIKKIGDMHLFDQGWNKLRETIFAHQKRLGIMPNRANLTPWPKELRNGIPLVRWRRSSSSSKRTSTGLTSPTDHEIGRVRRPRILTSDKFSIITTQQF
jgi:arylsulfatase A-like enzyme